MKCPKCGIDAQINKSGTEVTGDDSPDTPTRVFTALTFSCRNPQCDQYQKEVGQIRHQIYPATEGTDGTRSD